MPSSIFSHRRTLVGSSGLNIPAPQAFFKMDGVSGGSEVDTVGGSLTFANNGTVGSTTGSKGNARGAFGTNNFLSMTSNSIFQIAADWSIGFWFKAGNTGVNRPIIARTGDANFPPFCWEWSVEQTSSDKILFRMSRDGNQGDSLADDLGTTVSTSAWLCIICDYRLSDKRLQVQSNNGTISSFTMGSGPFQNNVETWVGKRHFNINEWGTGYVDALSVWNVLLTTNERTNFYNGGVAAEYVGGVWS